MLDCAHAWDDVINVWKNHDKPADRFPFTQSVSFVINGPPDARCGSVSEDSNCAQTKQCDGFVGLDSGAADHLIWNSFVQINAVSLSTRMLSSSIVLFIVRISYSSNHRASA